MTSEETTQCLRRVVVFLHGVLLTGAALLFLLVRIPVLVHLIDRHCTRPIPHDLWATIYMTSWYVERAFLQRLANCVQAMLQLATCSATAWDVQYVLEDGGITRASRVRVEGQHALVQSTISDLVGELSGSQFFLI